MKKRFKSFAVAACLFLCGCTAQKQTEDTKEDIVTLEWYINFSWFAGSWGENLVSKAITDKVGVDIEFLVPKGNESEKLEAMIASDTLPDLITLGWWENQCQDMINKDKVYALNQLAEKYEPYFFKAANDKVIDWYTESDGNIYGYPNSTYSLTDFEEQDAIYSNQNFLVRKDIYEAIGKPDMTTPEGFFEAVKKAAEAFPKVDGEALIPIGCDEFQEKGCNSFDLYLQNFLAIPYEKNGKYYDRYTDSEYIKWLKVFRKLGEEGYLADDIFFDNRSQLEEKLQQGRYFCMFYQSSDIVNQQKILYDKNPEKIYMAVDGPKNTNGDEPQLPISGGMNGWTCTFISKNCKDPEKAIQLLTYMISEEGQKMIYLGVEGSMYEMVDGKPKVKKEIQKLLNSNRDAYDQIYGADDTYWMLQDTIMQLKWKTEGENPVEQLQQWTKPYLVYTSQYELNFGEKVRENIRYKKMQKIWGKTLPQLLLAKSDKEFDRILNEYKKERKAAGYDQFVEDATKQYKENKERLKE